MQIRGCGVGGSCFIDSYSSCPDVCTRLFDSCACRQRACHAASRLSVLVLLCSHLHALSIRSSMISDDARRSLRPASGLSGLAQIGSSLSGGRANWRSVLLTSLILPPFSPSPYMRSDASMSPFRARFAPEMTPARNSRVVGGIALKSGLCAGVLKRCGDRPAVAM